MSVVDQTARNSANSAQRTANSAQSTANSAQSTADNALKIAKQARTDASNAAKAAKRAQSTADDALKKAKTNAGAIAKLDKRVRLLEQRMSRLEGIVEKLLNQVIQLQQNVVKGMAEVKGAVQNSAARTEKVVSKNTGAIASMEAFRLYNQAKKPVEKFEGQHDHLNGLYESAIDNQVIEIEKSNALIEEVLLDARRNVEDFGSHIYEILRQDFAPLEQRESSYTKILKKNNEEIDANRIQSRQSLLDKNIEEFRVELDKRIDAKEVFTNQIKNNHELDVESTGDFFIPAVISNVDEQNWSIYCDSNIEQSKDETSHVTIESNPKYNDITNGIKSKITQTLAVSQKRQATDNELADIKAALNELVKNNTITQELNQGYLDYLEAFGVHFRDMK